MFNMFRRSNYCIKTSRRCGSSRQSCGNCRCECTREVPNINEITYDELIRKVREGAILIDTRTRQEFLEDHLMGAILIPYYDISKKIASVVPNKDETIVVYCKNGGRSAMAYEILNRLGYSNIYNLKGGMEEI